MSKYQEALEKIKNVLKEMANLKDSEPICEEEIELFESLINNFTTVSKRHDNLVMTHNKTCNALDKACEKLGIYDYRANMNPNQYAPITYKNADEWKEWCLNND